MADARSARELRKLLNQVARGIERGAERYATQVALRTRDIVADRTPIDTGRASGSWNLSVGTPNRETLPENFNQSHDASISLSAPLLGLIDVEGFRLGAPFWISDNVPYIQFLEAGSSRQAPAGMVGITMATIASEAPRIPFEIRPR